MKTLIAYFSFSGNNEMLAKELQNMVRGDLYQIRERRKRSGISIFLDVLFKRVPKIEKPDIAINQYDHVIIVGPVWAGRIANPVKSFLKLEKDNLRDYSFISLCGNGGNKHLRQELTSLSGKTPVSIMELPVNDLLPVMKKDKVKFTSGYRINRQDLNTFKPSIEKFLKEAVPAEQVQQPA